MVVPDSVLHSAMPWKMAVSGEDFRESVWAVRNILDVFVGRVNRYYLLKGDAEEKSDTVLGEI